MQQSWLIRCMWGEGSCWAMAYLVVMCNAGCCATSCSCAYSTSLDQLSKIEDASQFYRMLLPLVGRSHACMHALKKGALHLHSLPHTIYLFTLLIGCATEYICCGVLGILLSTCTRLFFTCPWVIPPLQERVWKFPCVHSPPDGTLCCVYAIFLFLILS
jgi:hypothetical protein